MKTARLLTIILLLTQSANAQDTVTASSLLDKLIPVWVKPAIEKSEVAKNYTIVDAINPFYLEADFTGDKLDDIAFFVQSKLDGKKGVMIVNRGKNTIFIIGGGKDTGLGDHMNWCQAWFVYRDKGLFDGIGKRTATLKSPAILMQKSEKSSLYIYWTGKKYKTHAQIFSS